MLLRRKEVYIIVKTVIDIERLHWYFFTKYFLIEKNSLEGVPSEKTF